MLSPSSATVASRTFAPSSLLKSCVKTTHCGSSLRYEHIFNELIDIASYRTLHAAATIIEGRGAIEAILRGDDDRLMVVVGYVVLTVQMSLLTY